MDSLTFKQFAKSKGFDLMGVSKAEFLTKQAPLLESWLKQSMHGEMSYMENHFDLRLDPSKLVPGAKSVISFLFNYFPEKDYFKNEEIKISKYAYGQDYHKVIRKKLKSFFNEIKMQYGNIEGRIFIDSAPVMDKVWAEKSGLGWIGKNGNLISKQKGSFFFIGHLITDLEFNNYDHPVKDYCGSCTKCIDACPTNAIVSPQVVNGSKCISYLTIELKSKIPIEFQNKMDGWIFGCDICQDVCPWNRFSTPHQESEFNILKELINQNPKNFLNLTDAQFEETFAQSAIKRIKLDGLKRNIEFVSTDLLT